MPSSSSTSNTTEPSSTVSLSSTNVTSSTDPTPTNLVSPPLLSPKIYERRVQFLAVGFLTLFLAYSSAQLLQTPLNKTLGYACLLTLYACFGMAAIAAPSIVGKYGPRKLLAISAVGYVIMVASNLYPTPGLLIPGCIIVGICAATLWSSQGTYIGGCAVQLAQQTNRPLTECTSQLNASFYSIFMLSGGISAIGASLIIMSVANAIKVLFIVLTIIGLVGIVLLGSLPESNDETNRWIIFPPWFMHINVWYNCFTSITSTSNNNNNTINNSSTNTSSSSSTIDIKHTTDNDKPSLLKVGPSDATDLHQQWSELSPNHNANTQHTSSLSSEQSTTSITNHINVNVGSEENTATNNTIDTKPIIIDISSSTDTVTSTDTQDSISNKIHRTTSSVRRRNTNQEEENKTIANNLQSNTSTSVANHPIPPRPSLKFMMKFLVTDYRMRFIIPLIITTGAGSGFISGAWYGGVVGRALGLEYVGFIGSIYSFTAAFATKGWGKLAQRKTFGRRWSFVSAIIAHLCWYFAFALWSYSNIDNNTNTDKFIPGTSQRDGAYAMLFIGVFIYATFDPVYNSFVPATLQAFFPSGPEAPCAMASIRAMYSLGFAGQQAVSISLGQKYIAAQCVELFIMLSLAASALYYLHNHICSIDSSGSIATTNTSTTTTSNTENKDIPIDKDIKVEKKHEAADEWK